MVKFAAYSASEGFQKDFSIRAHTKSNVLYNFLAINFLTGPPAYLDLRFGSASLHGVQ
jgi:hypothetical protein